MKSNVYKIGNGDKDVTVILQESEKVAAYVGLNQKQEMQLRLLCEEMNAMLPRLVDDYEGLFWIDFEDSVCKINASITFAEYSSDKKKELIALAKDKKNAAAKGLVGKIRCAIEEFFLSEGAVKSGDATTGMYFMPALGGDVAAGMYSAPWSSTGTDYHYLWELSQYKERAQKEKEEWDELEKSIIVSVADDVIVGVKGKQATITIVKKFS